MGQLEIAIKPFMEYSDLVARLSSRGMLIRDPLRAQRKLTQVGYYRLSGYWHPALKFKFLSAGVIEKQDVFEEGTSFESIFELYVFDKRLRLELSCAIERIEVFLRTVIAHELGRIDPQAHCQKKNFSRFATAIDDRRGLSDFDTWHKRHNDLIATSREDSVQSHLRSGKPIPIWVACETWNFGTLSKLYSMLNGSNQQMICDRLNIDKRQTLDNWLINLNGIRNRCAHHSRVCNRPNIRTLMIPSTSYFDLLDLDQVARNKLYGFIAVVWYILLKIAPGSDWIVRIARLVDQMPKVNGFSTRSMGFPEGGFPQALRSEKPHSFARNAGAPKP